MISSLRVGGGLKECGGRRAEGEGIEEVRVREVAKREERKTIRKREKKKRGEDGRETRIERGG